MRVLRVRVELGPTSRLGLVCPEGHGSLPVPAKTVTVDIAVRHLAGHPMTYEVAIAMGGARWICPDEQVQCCLPGRNTVFSVDIIDNQPKTNLNAFTHWWGNTENS